jgi:RNA polymerase sigma-70 factor, ECF subfamily
MDDEAVALPDALVTSRDLEREFEDQLRECATLAFRVAYAVLRQREDAEDVAQEAFAKAYRAYRQLREREAFRGWLVRMTWRLALDRQRANRRRLSRESLYESIREDAAADFLARQREQQLWQAIDALPEKLRVVVVLAAIEGHNVREVSRLLGLPEGTVKSRLFSARQLLKERLLCPKT